MSLSHGKTMKIIKSAKKLHMSTTSPAFKQTQIYFRLANLKPYMPYRYFKLLMLVLVIILGNYYKMYICVI